MRKLLWLLFFPLVAQAAGEGAWQASGMGITLNHRGQSASSDPLVPSQPVSGLMTLVAWRYELNGPTPAGLRVRFMFSVPLCRAGRAKWDHQRVQ